MEILLLKDMRLKLTAVLGILFLVVSCQRQPEEVSIPVLPLDLTSATSVPYQVVRTDYLFSYPECMWIDGDCLIVQDKRAVTKLFHLISLTDGLLKEEFCLWGDGPGEYSDATLNTVWDRTKGTLSYFSANKRALVTYRKYGDFFKYSDSHSLRGMEGSKDTHFKEMIPCGKYYIALGERGIFQQRRFAVLDSACQIMNQLGNYPALSDLLVDPENDLQKMLFDPALFKISPDWGKAVFATYRGALIQFYDLKGLPDSIHHVYSRQLEVPIKKSQISKEHEGWVYGFEDVSVTDSAVYAIYNGETAEENPLLGKKILVFDWQGNLQKIYQLDLNLRCLTIDERRHCIYAVGYTEEDGFFLVTINM